MSERTRAARRKGDAATLFPLQAALGYSIAQTLFMGKWTVIVEGITDFWILKALNACLASQGDPDALNSDAVLIHAGGTSRLMPLASVMFASMSEVDGKLIVLVDSDAPGKQAAKSFEKEFGVEAPVVMLGTALGLTEATIEDIVPRADYADAVKKALGRSFTLDAKEKAVTTNVECLEMLYSRKGWGKFGMAEKAAVALELIGHWGKDCAKVPAETLESGRKIFRELNRHFEPAGT